MANRRNSRKEHIDAERTNGVQTVAATRRTPEITLDGENGEFYIKGCSMPENVNAFYAPILKYIDQYLEHPLSQTRIVFNLEYINSSSTQMLLAILYKLKKLTELGFSLKIEWHYMEDDDDIYETGKTFSELSGLSFEFHQHI